MSGPRVEIEAGETSDLTKRLALGVCASALALFVAECGARAVLAVNAHPGMVFDDEIIYTGEPHGLLFGVALNDVGCIGPDVRVPKRAEERRILLLGGSTSYATDYVDSVRETVSRNNPGLVVSVVSCGKPRYTSWVNMVNFRDRLVRYSPDVVVTYLGINDSIYNSFSWVEGLPDIGFFDWRSARRSAFLALLRYHVVDKRLRSTPDFPAGPLRSAAMLRENIEAIIATARSAGTRVVLSTFAIALPTDDPKLRARILADEPLMRHFWGNIDSTVRAVREHNEVMVALAAAHGLSLARPERVLRRDSGYFKDICHMEQPGKALLGEAIGDAIGRLH